VKIVICGANGQLGSALQASLDGHSSHHAHAPAARHNGFEKRASVDQCQDPRTLLPPWEHGLKEFAEEKKKGSH
jgi:dTDP-4-dehydrorhamnose reductase